MGGPQAGEGQKLSWGVESRYKLCLNKEFQVCSRVFPVMSSPVAILSVLIDTLASSCLFLSLKKQTKTQQLQKTNQIDFVTVMIQYIASPTMHWSFPNQICSYFLKITKLLDRKWLALSLHSGGPKSKNCNFKALNISFRNCYKAYMFIL